MRARLPAQIGSNKRKATHVDAGSETFSDPGSIPGASTGLGEAARAASPHSAEPSEPPLHADPPLRVGGADAPRFAVPPCVAAFEDLR